MTETDAIISILVIVSLMLGVLFFMLIIPDKIGNDYIEQEICIKKGYDKLRFISNIGMVCIKHNPEPIAHLVYCENKNMTPLAYFGAKSEGCILLKELVAIK